MGESSEFKKIKTYCGHNPPPKPIEEIEKGLEEQFKKLEWLIVLILGITYIKEPVLHGASREVLLGGHESHVHCPRPCY